MFSQGGTDLRKEEIAFKIHNSVDEGFGEKTRENSRLESLVSSIEWEESDLVKEYNDLESVYVTRIECTRTTECDSHLRDEFPREHSTGRYRYSI